MENGSFLRDIFRDKDIFQYDIIFY